MRTKSLRVLRNLSITAACLGVATLITELFHRLALGPQNAILLFVLAVFLVSLLTDGYAYCLTAAVLGVLLFDYLITTPRLGFSFTIGFPITLLIMLAVALVTGSVTARIKLQARWAKENEQLTDMLYQINAQLLSAHGIEAIAQRVNLYIAERLARSSCVYPAQSSSMPGDEAVFASGVPGDLDADLFRQRLVRGRMDALLGDADAQAPETVPAPPVALYSLRMNGEPVGVLGVSTKHSRLGDAERRFLTLLAGQAAQALHVEALRQQRQQAIITAETEQNRNQFLRAISHDLRTPLTSIIGASSALIENSDALDPSMRLQLARDIHDDAAWLLNMVRNILFTTRMQADAMAVSRRTEAVEEVIAGVVAGIRKRFAGCVIRVAAPDRLIIAPMDALLIAQVLTNLLENALRYQPQLDGEVTVVLEEKDGYACVSVLDNGPGLSDAALATLFVPQTAAGMRIDASRGFGMGLSICRTIITAHHGTIEGGNREGGGAVFRIRLPMEEVPR